MTSGFEQEFKTVNLLINSATTTGRTDAFIITFVKMEKQVRRIFSFLIYQYPSFDPTHKKAISKTISSKDFLYFGNFIKGINSLYSKTLGEIVGAGYYDSFQRKLKNSKRIRNKILHGQLTGESLSKSDLIRGVGIIEEWCSVVAEKMQAEIGYDGFDRNSYRKSSIKGLVSKYRTQITTIQELDAFIESEMK